MLQYAHRMWGQEEGLFQPTVYSLLQTHDGFLWLGTQDSLIRFDGIHFREFADGNSFLRGSTVRALLKDKRGNLWAATLGSGIARIAADGSVKHFSVRNGLPGDTVFCLANIGEAVWACTTEGMVRITGDSVRAFTKADGLPTKRIRTACAAPDGTLWVAGFDFGLVRSRGDRFVSSPDALPAGATAAVLACDADGSLWAGTSSGLVHLEGTRSRLYSVRDGLPDDDVSALLIGPAHTLWIGTNDGVSRLRNDEVSVFRTSDGLSHSQVLSLCYDREGTLWAGTKNGLDQFTDGSVTPYSTAEGLLSNDVGPVLEDQAGRLWIGTLDQGLNWFDGHRFHALTARDGLLSNQVLSLTHDPAGDLWVGTAAGINRVHNGRVAASYGASRGVAHGDVRSLFVDARGMLWAGTGAGLLYMDSAAGRFRLMTPAGKAAPQEVIALGAGRMVSLFASTEAPALYLLQNGRLSTRKLETTHPVDCFFHDTARHTLWMGTLGSGLLRWKNNALARVFVRDGLYDNRIYSIQQDAHGDLWFASSKGIFRVNDQELENFADGKAKAIRSLPFSTGQLRFECRSGVQPAAARTRDGRLWFSTTTGLVVVDPLRLVSNHVPPPARITLLLANGKRFNNNEPDLQPGEADNLEIRYAGLSFISPEKVTFRYKLEGYDRAWVDAGERRVAFYTNLPPRHFRFLVEARNADGVWSETPAALRFTLLPRFYQRVWFWPLMTLLCALLVVAFVRIRMRRLRRRFALVLAERSRIARELHDTLLQGLSGITMQLQALWTRLPASSPEKRLLGEIIADAGKCSGEARQSLWGLRSSAASGPPFWQKLADLARQAVSGKPIALSLAIDQVSLADLPDAEYQLLRIAQESIANALKHAGASRLTVNLQIARDQLEMSIEDNGIGIAEPLLESAGHFGLAALRERAAEIDAEIAVRTSPETGTCVAVSLDLQRKLDAEGNLSASEIHHL